jgi:head-tail adaptor
MPGGAGKKTELIIAERETLTRAAGGSMTSTWDEIGRFYAAVRWVRGGEQTRQGAVREIAVNKFIALSAAVEALSLTTKDRLDWNGEKYNIRERPRRLARIAEIEIIAEAGVTQ